MRESAHEEDRLAEARRLLVGRRDVFWWLFGVASPIFTAVFMWEAPPLEASFGVGGLAIFGGYFLRMPWARSALFLLPLSGAFLAIPHGKDAMVPAWIACAIGGAVVLAAFRSPRNRLVFGLDVEPEALRRLAGPAPARDASGAVM